MDHDSVVNDWRQNAERNDDENYEFLRSMKHREYGFDPDELAHELHERALQIVDCTRCANCCKTMNIKFDVARGFWQGHFRGLREPVGRGFDRGLKRANRSGLPMLA